MSKTSKTVLFPVLLALIISLSLAYAAFDSSDLKGNTSSLKITRITPRGTDVKPGRQIVLKFNMPVVPLGRMGRSSQEIPVSVSPGLKGEWRWLNTSTLALHLDHDNRMKYATRYVVRIRPEFVARSGAKMDKGLVHRFETERPEIEYHRFHTWRGPGNPVIGLYFNQGVDKERALSCLYFAEGEGVRVPAGLYEKRGGKKDRSLYIQPKESLPPGTKVSLRVSPGIVSKEGVLPGKVTRTVVVFHTFPAFRFLGITGRDVNDNEIFLEPAAVRGTELLFNPLGAVSLVFSSPVSARSEGPHLETVPDLRGGRKDYDPWADAPLGRWYLSAPIREHYYLHLPRPLKAAQRYHVASSPDFRDMFGRRLESPVDLVFRTSHRPPSLHLKNRISVLERHENTHVPLILTNLNKINVKYRHINEPARYSTLRDLNKCEGDFNARKEASFSCNPVEDLAYAFPLKIREILGGKSGALAGVLTSDPESKSGCTIKFFSQVTNLAVHAKLGHHNTVVWVTGMDDGEPVEGAKVEIFPGNRISPAATAKTDKRGIALLKGLVHMDPYLERFEGYFQKKFGIVRVSTPEDIAVLPLVVEFSDDLWWYYPRNEEKYSHMKAWGTTSQGIYRLGDRVDYKLYVRDQDNRSFVSPRLSPYLLKVKGPTGKVIHTRKETALSEFGSLFGSFEIPEGGVSGRYTFHLKAGFGKGPSWRPMTILVTDFTPAPFKVNTEIKGRKFKIGDKVVLLTGARLHSGGPYGKARARVTVKLRPTPFMPSNEALKEFRFDTDPGREVQVYREKGILDKEGNLATEFLLKESSIICGDLIVESAVRDDRGKNIAGRATADYMGRDRLAGIRFDRWILKEGEKAGFQVAVADEEGELLSGSRVRLVIEYDRVTGTRVKGAGNAYLLKYHHEKERLKTISFISEREPTGFEFTPEKPGRYFISARVTDTSGRIHATTVQKYAAGKGVTLWEMPNDNRLPIVPAQDTYKVGDKARFLVKNPYPGAKALICIERLGVMKQWTETLSGNTPVIEFEIEPDFVPGFYLSVLVHSPRTEKPLGKNNVDLGKPACRIGYESVRVNDPCKELTIKADTDREEYRPGEQVTLDISVKDIKGNHPETELAVAVLDEAVLDLIREGSRYFDPYEGFYDLEPRDVQNYNLLLRLVGRQRFEKKGADPGGGGGSDLKMRSLFEFVSYWNPEIYPDSEGRASVSFSLPDNLTGWRILVLGVSRDDLMGLGQSGFVTNKETEIKPALPNQVIEGDSFEGVFTIMNRTDKKRTLEVSAYARGEGVEARHIKDRIPAFPYVRNKVRIPVQVSKSGTVTFEVRAGDEQDRDGLIIPLEVRKKAAVEVAAEYGTTVAKKISEAYAFPGNMRSDTGRVSLVAAPTVISSLEGAFKYMKAYPYTCWEQKLSKGLMAMHYVNLKPYLAESFEWEDAENTVLDMLSEAGGFQAPNGAMCYYVPEDRYASPYLSAYTALAFNWLKQRGYDPDPAVEKALFSYIKGLLRRDAFPTFYTRGMSSTVRAVALAALAEKGEAGQEELLRYLPHVQHMDLFGKAHFLLAVACLDDTEEMATKVYHTIMAHASERGGKVMFSDTVYGETHEGDFNRILTSDIRTNAAVLSAILAMEGDYGTADDPDKAEGEGKLASSDMPFKVVRFLSQARKRKDHWENTQENVFCMQALTAFSRIYEAESPDFLVTAAMDKKEFGRASFDDLKDAAKELNRPVQPGDPGREAELTITKEGRGRLYYAARLFYSPEELKAEPVNAGIEVRREYYVQEKGSWRLLEKEPMSIRQGDLIRVDLFVSLPSSGNFVVVDDPVPGGLEPVNRSLATASQVDADRASGDYAGSSWWHKHGDWQSFGYSRWSFYHQEILHHAVRFYSEYLPAGNYHLSYTAQAIAPGKFQVMPLHAGELYDPDVYGQGMPQTLKVSRTKQAPEQE